MSKELHIIVETIFCDYETDLEVRQRYLDRWLVSLRYLAKVRPPENSTVTYLVYISRDKVEELTSVKNILKTFPESARQRFSFMLYDHPAEGYGYDDAKHPDLRMNPNKSSSNRDRLFRRAIKENDLRLNAKWIVRMAIDDDDIWMPWHLEEVARYSKLGREADRIVMVGMRNIVVPYVETGSADVVEFSRHMTGSKFYVAQEDQFVKLSGFSPWSMPESIGQPTLDRMNRYDVKIKSTNNNQPGFLYCRWGHNITSSAKNTYYHSKYFEYQFSDILSLTDDTERALANTPLRALTQLN